MHQLYTVTGALALELEIDGMYPAHFSTAGLV